MSVPSDQEIVHGLVEDLPVGLWVARAPGGEFVYANRTFGEIMGQGGRDDAQAGGYSEPYGIFTRDGKPYPEHRLPFVRALEAKRVVEVDDITIHRPDGRRVHVRAFARPVHDGAGNITHVVIAFFDITREVDAERARAESERRLHRAQRLEAVGTLAGGIAHDFNNLIFGIKLLASELAGGEKDSQKRAALELIDDITERSATLTRSLLGFARRGQHRPVPVALDDVIGQMRELLTLTLTNVQISFELGAADRGAVVGDQSQLEQVVMNLIVNARDALRDTQGGRVVVRTRTVMLAAPPMLATGVAAAGANVVLEVADDGPGIPPELRERVFEPYFTTKDQGAERGTGLGLATVFGIVENHGGSIEIGTGLAGRGTTMRVYLPAALQPAEPPSLPSPRETPGGSGTILVVDDDATVRRAVALALRGLGYATLVAAEGIEAIEMFELHRAKIRAVVLDLVMPGMSGRAIYGALRGIEPNVAVLVMSGYTMNDDMQALLELGVRGFVAKPCTVDALARALADVIKAP